ncbi:MAG: hypothetical protein WD751_02315 [Anaerolineales bacterium]
MSLYKYESREEYLRAQISRSRKKSAYCKVFFRDVIRYRQLLKMGQKHAETFDPILCLGVRTGAEVNLFRSTFFGPLMKFAAIRAIAIRRDTTNLGSSKIHLARYFGVGSGGVQDGRVIGVELAPETPRPDIWIGSFDDLPAEWVGRFRLLYSNSFDHSQDPMRTVAEWKRVAAPGAYVILAYAANYSPTPSDPFGGMELAEIMDLWKSPVIFCSETWNEVGYKEICFQLQ